MRLPPKWVRRLIIDPLFVVGLGLLVLTLPVALIAATFISRYVPGKWRPLRIAWFIFLYLAIDIVAVVGLFLTWIGSGFGWKLREPFFEKVHYGLLRWMLRRVVNSAKFTFKLRIIPDGPAPTTMGVMGRRPVLVLSRHAGPGDSFLLINGLCNGYDRKPRIVMKEFLQWDPAVDVLLNRLPVTFVPAGRKGREVLLEAIAELSGTMDSDDAFVIFPEGANYTERRRERAIQKLSEIGRPDLAERAKELERTLPPRTTGLKAALGAAPPNSDVLLVGHCGLEGFATPGDIWKGMPMDTNVLVKIWHVKAEDIPPEDDQEVWLFDMWAEIDAWIRENLSETGDLLFDDPEAY